jgi:hypothetical protein
LNFYSITQLVRGFLRFFLGLVGIFEGEVIIKLKNLFARWKEEEEEEELRQAPRDFLLQLWKIIQHLPGRNRLVTIYDHQFTPFWTFRI